MGAAATASTPPTTETSTPKQEQTSFLLTPRSMLPSWCESPRVKPEVAQQDVVSDKETSIEIPKLEEPPAASTEQRDVSEDANDEAPREEGNTVRTSEETQARAPAPVPEFTSVPKHVPNTKFECDYDKNPTKIFLSLQKKEWDASIRRAEEDTVEARTWVSRREAQGNLRWRLLPLHAAIIFKAPENVVEALLAAFPKGAQSKDDQGMLPLHLAFRHGSTEATVNLLLVAFPQSVSVEDRKGRIPLVLAQAAASANREAFVRALERGPTYYANAAAATERAAVTAEQRALFDSKLIEVEKKHQQDVSILKEERDGLNETIALLQNELAKQKGATQVLVDHVNSLEAHLRNKGETEKFLAVKAATLDTTMKEMDEELKEEIAQLKNENARLMEEMKEMNNVEAGKMSPEQIKKMEDKISKQDSDLKSLKMEWASTQARAAVLEAQLKSKIENEHELASQVSQLASKLANSAADSSNQVDMYSRRVQTLEAEREKLRATVNDLGKKLLTVSQFMNKMTVRNEETTKQLSEEAKAKQAKQNAKLLEEASNHEELIRTALAEREHMAGLLKKQEEEMERSAKKHQAILEQLAAMKAKSAPSEDESEIPLTNSINDEIKEVMNSVLGGMPQVPSDDSGDLVDAVMMSSSVVVSTPRASGSAEKKTFSSEPEQISLRTGSIDSEEDAQQCLEEALRALELKRTKSNADGSQLMSESDVSEAVSCNPSDEESLIK